MAGGTTVGCADFVGRWAVGVGDERWAMDVVVAWVVGLVVAEGVHVAWSSTRRTV